MRRGAKGLLLVLGALSVAAVAWAAPTHSNAAGPLLFSGTSIEDFADAYAAPGAITEVPDPTGGREAVLSLDVANRDVYPLTPTENPRAELLSPDIIRPGMEFWLATELFVPTDYPAVRAGEWVSLVAVYGAPYRGSSPWKLGLAGNSLQWQRNSTYGFDIPYKAPLVRGRWTRVLIHERFSRHGFVAMWIDGRPVRFFGDDTYNPSRHRPVWRLKMATRDYSNGAGRNSARIMQYRKAGIFREGTIFFGPLRVGRTRAAVLG